MSRNTTAAAYQPRNNTATSDPTVFRGQNAYRQNSNPYASQSNNNNPYYHSVNNQGDYHHHQNHHPHHHHHSPHDIAAQVPGHFDMHNSYHQNGVNNYHQNMPMPTTPGNMPNSPYDYHNHHHHHQHHHTPTQHYQQAPPQHYQQAQAPPHSSPQEIHQNPNSVAHNIQKQQSIETEISNIQCIVNKHGAATCPIRCHGIVQKSFQDKGYGFISCGEIEGQQVFYHFTQVLQKTPNQKLPIVPQTNDEVQFTLRYNSDKRAQAYEILILKEGTVNRLQIVSQKNLIFA